MRVARQLATALTFLTRLPAVARFAYPDAIAIAQSAYWWPAIGAVLGLFAGLCFHLALGLWHAEVAAVFAIASIAIVTGAFHEDGLADSADGMFGGYTVEKRLEIMKDSRIGTFGALALLLNVAMMFAALITMPTLAAMPALIIGHSLARFSSLPLTYALPYARFTGTNKPVAEHMSLPVVIFGGLFTAGIATALCFYPGINDAALHTIRLKVAASLLGAVILWILAAWFCKQKLNGVTGDTLGAINQLTLTWCLLCFAASPTAMLGSG